MIRGVGLALQQRQFRFPGEPEVLQLFDRKTLYEKIKAEICELFVVYFENKPDTDILKST